MNTRFRKAVAVTTHASNPITAGGLPCKALLVGGAGNALVRFAGSSSYILLTGLLAGHVYHFELTHVSNDASTTATAMVALY